MNVEIGTEAAQFPEKEYINVIAVAVQVGNGLQHSIHGSSRMYCEVKYTVHVSSAKLNVSSW